MAPLRVSIGYARNDDGRTRLIDALDAAQEEGEWDFPEIAEDLVLLGHGTMQDPRDFVVLYRERATSRFENRGWLASAELD